MSITRTASVVGLVLASWSIAVVPPAAAQDTLARARDLYTSAAYDEALELLERVDRPSVSASDEAEVDQYRAFCLLALGRSDDARKVIQQIVEANPSFQPSEAQASPRLVEAFRDVRRRVLPTVVRQTYTEAKAAFDRKDLDLAASRFESVVGWLDDADVVGATELADIRILSKGFLDLIKTTPKPLAAPVASAAGSANGTSPSVTSPNASSSAATDVPAVRTIYGPNDTDVTPPVPISQVMPPWHPTRRETQTQLYEGALVLVIDETGAVISINSQGLLPAPYVATLRRAASGWKFQPAVRNGVPVKYLKLVGIRLNPNG
jgi:hypothetical protein